LDHLQDAFAKIDGDTTSLEIYKSTLDYLARVPGWGTQWLRFHFDESTAIPVYSPKA
jgi:hypothetical protein